MGKGGEKNFACADAAGLVLGDCMHARGVCLRGFSLWVDGLLDG